MPLTEQQDIKLTRELLNHCRRIRRETGYDPVHLRSMLASERAQRTLRMISSRETSGLARLYELGAAALSIERYVLDSHWSGLLDPAIVAQCQANLRQT